MATYQTNEDGSLVKDGLEFIPINHRLYAKALEEVDSGESTILPYSPPSDLDYWRKQIYKLYDKAMRTLQGEYTDEEVKTFTPKQDAIREYQAGGLPGLSVENSTMLEALTGSTDPLIITAKLDRMVQASTNFKFYLATIERHRDEHLDQLVDGQDNTAVVDSLAVIYEAGL